MPPRKATAKKAPAKTTARKAAVTKAPVRKAAAKAVPAKRVTSIKERYSKTQILTQISETTELSKKDVQAVLDELSTIIEGHITKRGCGEFVLPGLMKISTVKKPARKARKGKNPFTGEETVFAAKPATVAVKVRALKKLKEMAV